MRTLSLLVLLVPLLSAPALSAGPASRPVLYVDLPAGWTEMAPKYKTVSEYASFPGGSFELVGGPASDFAPGLDLTAFAELMKRSAAASSELQNRTDTDLQTRTIAGREVVSYQITGERNGVTLRYRVMCLRVGDQFCKLICCAFPTEWEAAQPKFDELVGHLQLRGGEPPLTRSSRRRPRGVRR